MYRMNATSVFLEGFKFLFHTGEFEAWKYKQLCIWFAILFTQNKFGRIQKPIKTGVYDRKCLQILHFECKNTSIFEKKISPLWYKQNTCMLMF